MNSLPLLLLSHTQLDADRGSQFTSANLNEVAVELDLLQSVGRTGVLGQHH